MGGGVIVERMRRSGCGGAPGVYAFRVYAAAGESAAGWAP